MVQTSAEEAYRKFDDLTKKHIDNLRKLTKAIQDARIGRDNEATKQVDVGGWDAQFMSCPQCLAWHAWHA